MSHASRRRAGVSAAAGEPVVIAHPPRVRRLALVGFGAVARALVALLEQTAEELARERGVAFAATIVATRRRGVVVLPDGTRPADLAAEFLVAHARPIDELPAVLADLRTPYDVLVELSTVAPSDGEPAATYLRAALASGRGAVSANKGPIAWRGRELADLAAANGTALRYEATTMDCLPVHAIRECIVPVGRVTAFAGIVNSATNLILTAMAAGRSAAQALAEAQQLGIAEADPRNDTEGHDAVLKATILANLLLEPADPLTPDRVDRRGLEAVPDDWPSRAAAAGGRVRLVARGWREGPDGRVAAARVGPEELPLGHPLALVDGTSMALDVETEHAGTLHLALVESHVEQTAYAVLTDLLAIAEAR
jgi:homoserine dehydrogenase